jgi:hypothetical protein
MGQFDHLPINERQRKDLEYYATLPKGKEGCQGKNSNRPNPLIESLRSNKLPALLNKEIKGWKKDQKN